MQKTVAFYTLGCKVNQYETNAIAQRFIENGYKKVEFEDKADIYINGEYIYHKNKKLYNINDKRYLLGNHNLIDIMFALAISELFKLDTKKVVECINNFQGLEHRLECVGEYCDSRSYEVCD